MPRAETDNTEKPTQKYNIEINPVKMKEIVIDELKTKAVAAIKTRKKRVAKEIFNKAAGVETAEIEDETETEDE